MEAEQVEALLEIIKDISISLRLIGTDLELLNKSVKEVAVKIGDGNCRLEDMMQHM